MKQKFTSSLLCLLLLLSIALSGCRGKENDTPYSPTGTPKESVILSSPTATPKEIPSEAVNPKEDDTATNMESHESKPDTDPKVIQIWTSYGNDMHFAMLKFKELYPDFGFEINISDYSLSEISYNRVLDPALGSGEADVPDIYVSLSPDAVKYIKGEKYPYAATYEDLGLPVDTLLQEASIADYMVDYGTNPEGKLVALGYQSTAAAFLYRRSIAKEVWGTDEPKIIRDTIGPGWDKFFEAAEALKSKGYGICSGHEDLWHAIRSSSDQAWIVDGKLYIDPNREAFLDLSKRMIDNQYTNNTRMWREEWFGDMQDAGDKKIFGFFAPSWLISYVVKNNCGGEAVGNGTFGDWAVCEPPAGFFWSGTYVFANKDTKYKEAVGEIIKWMTLDTSETGFQYLWANGIMNNGIRDTVPSETVMEKSDGSLDILGGQNQFDVYIPAAKYANGNQATQYDDEIDFHWLNEVYEYISGNKTREQAIADFKQEVEEHLGFKAE